MFIEQKFKMRDGEELAVQIEDSGKPIWIIATHGVGEHLGRHKYIPELFRNDFNVVQYDLRGHGRSTGRRAYIKDFNVFMADLKELLNILVEKYQMNQFVLFGHSMGAMITASFMQNYVEDKVYPVGIILNAPPCGIPGAIGGIINMLPKETIPSLCKFPLSIPLGGLVDTNNLSHNPQIKVESLNDKLNSQKLESKLLLELVNTTQRTFIKPIGSKAKNFISIGSSDHIVDFIAVVNYFTHIDKSFKLTVFDNAFHELHHETEQYKKPYFDYLKNVIIQILAEKYPIF